IFGLLCGQLLRSGTLTAMRKVGIMLAVAAAGLSIGWVLGWLGVCPVVKRIWTPSWAIYSAGWTFLLLAGFYLLIDIARFKFWAYPLIVMGTNAIAVYCIWQLLGSWFLESMTRHLGPKAFNLFG